MLITPRNVLISCAAVVWAIGGVSARAEQKSDTIDPPSISIAPDSYYPLDDVIYIEGRAQARATVQIQFQKPGARSLRFSAHADGQGQWALAERVALEAGDWEVSARTYQDADHASAWSNPRIIKVMVTGITVAGVTVKFAFLASMILLLMVAGFAMGWYFFVRVRRLKSALAKKEIHEAHQSMHDGVARLRRDLVQDLSLLMARVHPPTPEEVVRKQQILAELEDLEGDVEREIEDVQDSL